jgi:hypothetical protein
MSENVKGSSSGKYEFSSVKFDGWKEQWEEQKAEIIANDTPAVEIIYGEYHIRIYARGVMTGAPEGMGLRVNRIPLEKFKSYIEGKESGAVSSPLSPASQDNFKTGTALYSSHGEDSPNSEEQ